MWTSDNGKQIAIAINLEQISLIQFLDGTKENSFNALKSFNRGIFVNPTLDKKNYLSLLKVFHPDVSNLDVEISTQITQVINLVKDGVLTASNPFSTNYSRQKPPQKKPEPDFKTWWQNSYANSSEKRQSPRNPDSSTQKTPKPDFETYSKYVPTKYWDIFGAINTFERDYSVDFRLFKRYHYAYFDTELEIVFRDRSCLYREKVTAIHRHFIQILHQVDLNRFTKNDLWKICELEAIPTPYTKSWRKNKADLVKYVLTHFLSLKNEPYEHSWTLTLSNPKPLWKHKFINPDYYHNFELFNRAENSKNTKQEPKSNHTQDNTCDYLNCGQYLKLIDRWLERDEFLDFLRLTRNLALKFGVKTRDVDGYPGYPIDILDRAWDKMLL